MCLLNITPPNWFVYFSVVEHSSMLWHCRHVVWWGLFLLGICCRGIAQYEYIIQSKQLMCYEQIQMQIGSFFCCCLNFARTLPERFVGILWDATKKLHQWKVFTFVWVSYGGKKKTTWKWTYSIYSFILSH